MTGFPTVTSATAFWIDHEYDQANSSDGISRYGAYIRQRISTSFAECWNGTSGDSGRERFAAAAWRTATSPVMVPGYVRRHPRLTGAQVERKRVGRVADRHRRAHRPLAGCARLLP